MGKKMTYKKSFSRPETSIKLNIQKWCQKPSSSIIWGVMGIFYFTEKTKSILEGSVFFPRETFTTHPWSFCKKARVKRKLTRDQFGQKNPGVKAGVINLADL